MNHGSIADPSFQDPVHIADLVARMRPCDAGLGGTGAIVCDGGQIRQWIEGPDASVAALWDRIRLDPRHRLHWTTAPAVVTSRHFPGSPMTLAMTTADLAQVDPCLIDDAVPPPDSPARTAPAATTDRAGCKATDARQAALRRLNPAHRAEACRLVNARATALADLLTGADPMEARGQLDRVLHLIGVSNQAALVQTVLDHLQNGWMTGAISALQRQLAVTLLQAALRPSLNVAENPQTDGCALVSVLPGTPDMCGVMLKVALLRRAGWSVRLLLPLTSAEILAVTDDLQPDLIVVAGSRLSARPSELAMLADLVPALADHSPAPVILGGKLAETDPNRLLQHGAAAVCGALPWIATIAAHLSPAAATQPGAIDRTNPAVSTDHALASFLAASRARATRR